MSVSDPRPPVPVYRGTAAGVGAFLGGYALTYVLTIGFVSAATITRYMSAVTGDSVRTSSFKIVGWLHYNAHFVSSQVPALFGPESTNFLTELSALTLVVFAVPAVCLFVAGMVTRGRVTRLTPRQTATHGLCVLIGYAPASLVASILLTDNTARGTAGPDPLLALVLAGVVYPALFAVAGAIAGNQLFGRPATTT